MASPDASLRLIQDLWDTLYNSRIIFLFTLRKQSCVSEMREKKLNYLRGALENFELILKLIYFLILIPTTDYTRHKKRSSEINNVIRNPHDNEQTTYRSLVP